MAETARRADEAGFLDRILARIERWAPGSEIDRMAPEDARAIARDLGLDAGDLGRLARGETDAARLLYARLEELGITMAAIEAAGVGSARDMERTCTLCADRPLCAHDLEERPGNDAWRRICPNNWTFDEMERRLRQG